MLCHFTPIFVVNSQEYKDADVRGSAPKGAEAACPLHGGVPRVIENARGCSV